MDPKTTLKNYINRILELQDQHQAHEPLTEAELRQVAVDLGMDEGELAFIQQQFEDYKQRARGFASYYNWEDAIEEYKEALTLNPIDRECLEEITQGYHEKWKQGGKDEDKEGAVSYARSLLEVDPDNAVGLRIISEIKSRDRSHVQPKATSNVKTRLVLVAFMAVMAMGLAIFFILQSSDNTLEGTMGRKSDSGVNTNPASPKVVPEVPNLKIPVNVFPGREEEAFEIKVLSSRVDDYGTSYAYKAYGYVEAMEELDELRVKATLLDKKGVAIFPGKEFRLIMGHEANVRPGDKVPWDMLIFEEKEQVIPVEGVRIEPVTVKKIGGSGNYPEAKELGSVIWDVPQPKGHELVVRERRLSFTQSAFIKKGYAKGEWEIENKGLEKYSRIKIRLVWKGSNKQSEGVTYALSEDFPFLLPGRKVPFGGTFEIGEEVAREFEGYEVHVIEWN